MGNDNSSLNTSSSLSPVITIGALLAMPEQVKGFDFKDYAKNNIWFCTMVVMMILFFVLCPLISKLCSCIEKCSNECCGVREPFKRLSEKICGCFRYCSELEPCERLSETITEYRIRRGEAENIGLERLERERETIVEIPSEENHDFDDNINPPPYEEQETIVEIPSDNPPPSYEELEENNHYWQELVVNGGSRNNSPLNRDLFSSFN